jgi:hypothetical protein
MCFMFFLVNFVSSLSCEFGGGGNRTRVRRYSTRGLYMFIFFLHLISRLLKKKDTAKPVLMMFRSSGSGQTRLAILLVGASQVPQELTRETACLKIRQQVAVVLHLLWSTFLARWVGPRHATSVSLPPSNPVRPHRSDYYYRGKTGYNSTRELTRQFCCDNISRTE